MNADPLMDRLESLFEQERDMLLQGQFESIAALSDLRETLLAELACSSPDPDRLGRLRKAAARNTALADAARAGISSAIKRVEEIRAAAGPIASYSDRGEARSIGIPRPEVERKL